MKLSPLGFEQTKMEVNAPVQRQKAKEPSAFKEALKTSADALLAGVQTATSAVGGPVLAAPISDLRHQLRGQGGGAYVSGTPGSFGGSGASPMAYRAADGTVNSVNPGALSAGSPNDVLRASMNGGMSKELELLSLQSQIQDHHRKITLMSNVMKAEHDTAKSAIQNIRA